MEKLTQERLKELLDYNPETGVFVNRVRRNNRAKAGDVTGCVGSCGYKRIQINGKLYLSHRLVFLYMEGYLPEHFVDHIDRNKLNNRWSNLRHVNHQCNLRNTGNHCSNKSGVKGVCLDKRNNKWKAYIKLDSKLRNLGHFNDFLEVVCHRLAAEQCLNWSGCDNNSPAYQYVKNNK